MSYSLLSATQALAKLKQGALLVDIRSHDEYARSHIQGALNIPPEALPSDLGNGREVIFHCKSGMRTQQQADNLAASVAGQAFVLEGGLDAWRAQGLPVVDDKSQPLDIMRQVQIGAGSLVVLGLLLGSLLHPAFYWLAAFVGCGLIFAGVTGFCGMAKLLALMPWNKR